MEAPDDLQGRSLVPLLIAPETAGKEAVYTVVTRWEGLGKAARTAHWRYSKWSDGKELYDLKNDIDEHHNLTRSPENSRTLKVMRRHLAKMEKKHTLVKIAHQNV